MNIDGNLIPIFEFGAIMIIAVTAILSTAISKYKLKVEQIRADAMVRAEEVRSRNQLELERLMHQEHGATTEPTQNYEDISRNNSRVRE